MFATLQCNKDALCVKRSNHLPFQSQGQQHSACNNCRAKKLKCTGRKNDCDRCRTKGIQCVYVEPAHSKGAKRRRSNQSSATNTSRSSSTSISTPPAVSVDAAPDMTVLLLDPIPRTPSRYVPLPRADSIEPNDKPTKDSVPIAGGDMGFSTGTNFMNLVETISSNDGAGAPNGETSFTSSSTPEANGLNHLTFCHDLTNLEPVVEDSFGFDFEMESNDKLMGLGGDLDDNCSFLSDFSYDISVLSSPMHLPSPLNSPSIEPSTPAGRALSQGRLGQRNTSRMSSEKEASNQPGVGSLPSSTNSYSSPSCSCMHTALGILENLEVKNSRLNLYAVDHVLCFKKRALTQCKAMLDCRNCNALSGFMMLLVVICEKMVASFERLVTRFHDEQKQQHHDTPSSLGSWAKADGTGLGGGQSIFLGDYEVDLAEERWSLVRVLVMLQLKSLGNLLMRLKSVVSPWNWETHRTILVSIERRFRDIAASLRRMDAVRESSMVRNT